MKEKASKVGKNMILTVFAGALSAFGLWVFVFPFDFVPSGVDGIAVALQELTGLNAGYFNLVFNIILLFIACFFINRRYVVYTGMFSGLSATLCIFLEKINFYQYTYPENAMVSALFAGIFAGLSIGIMLRLRASSGGLDIIAAIIQKRKGHLQIERIISLLSYIIVGSSFFIYWDLNCILLSAIQIFSAEITVKAILKDTRNAIEVKIVTKDIDKIKDDIIEKLAHSATVVEAKGLYLAEKQTFLFAVINVRQLGELYRILKDYPDAFVYYSDVMGVHGYFDR